MCESGTSFLVKDFFNEAYKTEAMGIDIIFGSHLAQVYMLKKVEKSA